MVPPQVIRVSRAAPSRADWSSSQRGSLVRSSGTCTPFRRVERRERVTVRDDRALGELAQLPTARLLVGTGPGTVCRSTPPRLGPVHRSVEFALSNSNSNIRKGGSVIKGLGTK